MWSVPGRSSPFTVLNPPQGHLLSLDLRWFARMCICRFPDLLSQLRTIRPIRCLIKHPLCVVYQSTWLGTCCKKVYFNDCTVSLVFQWVCTDTNCHFLNILCIWYLHYWTKHLQFDYCEESELNRCIIYLHRINC